MTGTIGYDKKGAVFPSKDEDHDSYEAPESQPYGEHQGTLDTTGDSPQDASAVSDVFKEADEFFANTDVPEGIAQAPELDPEASGEDALKPDYSNYDGPHYEPTEEEARAQDEVEGAEEVTRPVYESGVGEVEDGEVHRKDEDPFDDGVEVDDEDLFDPSKHSVSDVNAYLAKADETERKRVLEAEKADKNRSTVNGND